jgi:hypothetical protein
MQEDHLMKERHRALIKEKRRRGPLLRPRNNLCTNLKKEGMGREDGNKGQCLRWRLKYLRGM